MLGFKTKKQTRKSIFLKFAIVSFVLLLIVFYSINLKNIWEVNSQVAKSDDSLSWDQIKNDFSSTMNQVTSRFEEAKKKQTAVASGLLIDKLVSNINQEAASSSVNQNSALVNQLASGTLNNIIVSSSKPIVIESNAALNSLESKLNLNKNKK